MEQLALYIAFAVFFVWSVGFVLSLVAALLNLCGLHFSFSFKPIHRMWDTTVSSFKRIHFNRPVSKKSVQHTTA